MNVIVIGAGGHARSVCDVLLSAGEHRIIGLIDTTVKHGFFGLPVLGGDELLPDLYSRDKAQGAGMLLAIMPCGHAS